MKLWQFDNLTNFKLFLITNILRRRLLSWLKKVLVLKTFVLFFVLSVNGFQNNDIWIHFVNENLNSVFQISKIMFITENLGFGSFSITTEN